MRSLADSALDYFNAGGAVMLPLFAAAFALWYALGYRFMTLRRGTALSVRAALERRKTAANALGSDGILTRSVKTALSIARRLPRRDLRRALDDALAPIETDLRRGRSLIRATVAVAPLLGLLGTVSGMIETFDSLSEMALFSRSGGIAAGIAEALLTTQMGLSVAVPGLVLGRLLDRREATLAREIDQLKHILCAEQRKAAELSTSGGAR